MCKFQLKYQISVGLSRFHFGDPCQYKQAKQCRVPCYRYNCERIHLQPPIKIVMNISAIQQNLCYMLKLDSLTVWQLCWRTKLFGVDKNLASFVLPKTKLNQIKISRTSEYLRFILISWIFCMNPTYLYSAAQVWVSQHNEEVFLTDSITTFTINKHSNIKFNYVHYWINYALTIGQKIWSLWKQQTWALPSTTSIQLTWKSKENKRFIQPQGKK